MGSGLLRTVQVLLALLFIACGTVGVLWALDVIDPGEARATLLRIGVVLGICLATALALVAVFSIGRRRSGDGS